MGKAGYDEQTLLQEVMGILAEMTAGWDSGFAGAIGPNARLGADLGLESIDIVQLAVAIQQRVQRKDLPFKRLFMPDERTVTDPTISDVARFVSAHLNNMSGGERGVA